MRDPLLKFAASHDPGRAINPQIVEGQLQGGLVQGIGAGLMEEVVYNDDAQLVTGSFMDYAIPKADDVPWIDVALDEHPSVVNDLGVKGVGESGCIAPAGVIANAVEDAVADLGVTLTEVPVTSARLFAALGAAARRRHSLARGWIGRHPRGTRQGAWAARARPSSHDDAAPVTQQTHDRNVEQQERSRTAARKVPGSR